MSNQNDKNQVETTGHEWDGIEEYNNPLPKWWVWIFYACIIWAIGYSIAYPAWPLIKGATPGLLGWSTRANVQADIDAVDERNGAINERLASAEPAAIADDAELLGYAQNAGASVFRANCSQCHGSGAQGVQAGGFPTLIDDDWLWGGTMDDIVYTVTHGIRNEQDGEARWSEMPAFGDILPEEEITAVVQHVRALSGQEHDAALAATGAEVFDINCSSCHGVDGKGDQFQGAPNLTDAIWLYGGDEDTITHTVTYSRFGVMPAWNLDARPGSGLTEAEIKAVATYVHSLGGGI
ncbi:MAG: cytochrome-c oxidase, cbb3-type subunit III [Rhodobacterales bacterium]|nr:MAG: cytochrome-c oxidase, cbb3-type subunit III [Rhodobacterales bacterium]